MSTMIRKQRMSEEITLSSCYEMAYFEKRRFTYFVVFQLGPSTVQKHSQENLSTPTVDALLYNAMRKTLSILSPQIRKLFWLNEFFLPQRRETRVEEGGGGNQKAKQKSIIDGTVK